jgi:hypothetical protein
LLLGLWDREALWLPQVLWDRRRALFCGAFCGGQLGFVLPTPGVGKVSVGQSEWAKQKYVSGDALDFSPAVSFQKHFSSL